MKACGCEGLVRVHPVIRIFVTLMLCTWSDDRIRLRRYFLLVSPRAIRTFVMKRFLNCSLMRVCTSGAAGLFDIFGQRARVVTLGTLAHDVARVHNDFRAVGKDFASILSRRGSASPND